MTSGKKMTVLPEFLKRLINHVYAYMYVNLKKCNYLRHYYTGIGPTYFKFYQTGRSS